MGEIGVGGKCGTGVEEKIKESRDGDKTGEVVEKEKKFGGK